MGERTFSVNAAETENEIVAAESVDESVGTEKFENGSFKYSFLEDGTVSLDGFIDSIINDSIVLNSIYFLSIPSQVEGYTVTRIGEKAFSKCKKLERVSIPNTITSGYTLGSEAPFNGCSSLNTIILQDGIKSIPRYIFANCYALENITIPDGVEEIGIKAFFNCRSLTSINIPNTVTSGYTLGSEAPFNGCDSLKTITIQDGIKTIPRNIFANCSALEIIEIPKGILEIKMSAFANCRELKYSIIFSGSAKYEEKVFSGCDKLTIVSYIGSTAEKYANDNNIPFKEIGTYTSFVTIQNDKKLYTCTK